MAEGTLLISGGRRGEGPVVQSVSRAGLLRHEAVPPRDTADAQPVVGCGRALTGEEIAIVDPESRVRLADTRVGEIWASGPNVALGYWRNPEATEATFGARIAGEDERAWLRTGDLGFLDESGELFITGRIKDVMIIRGANHYPQDIEDTVQQSHPALRRHGAEGLPGLTLEGWRASRGLGTVKACQLTAAFELARRILLRPTSDFRVSSPREAYDLVRDLKRVRKEHLVALYLDAQNILIQRETITIGSLNTTRTHPREILQPAILHSALSFVLVHNHPSGSLEPSRDDVDFTRSIARAAELMGVGLADHLIVSPRGYVSLKERGVL